MQERRHHVRMMSPGGHRHGLEPVRNALPARKATLNVAGGRSNAGRLAGSVHVFVLIVFLIAFVAGGGYLYSVNRSAVQGYHMRTLEKEIDKLKQNNAELRIAEADLRSLYRIETAEEELGMQKLDTIIYLEEHGPIALR
ncbi:MAG: hypothetical protein AAB547_00915 [Patescibacteria group bacterium]